MRIHLATWRNTWTDSLDLAWHAREFIDAGLRRAQVHACWGSEATARDSRISLRLHSSIIADFLTADEDLAQDCCACETGGENHLYLPKGSWRIELDTVFVNNIQI